MPQTLIEPRRHGRQICMTHQALPYQIYTVPVMRHRIQRPPFGLVDTALGVVALADAVETVQLVHDVEVDSVLSHEGAVVRGVVGPEVVFGLFGCEEEESVFMVGCQSAVGLIWSDDEDRQGKA